MPTFIERLRKTKIWANKRGGMGGTIVEIAISLILVAALFPAALTLLGDYTPEVGTIVEAVWPYLGGFAVLGVALYFIVPVIKENF